MPLPLEGPNEDDEELVEVTDDTPGVAWALMQAMGDLAVALGTLNGLTGLDPELFLPRRPHETVH
jgi:hypothetical protein